MSAPGAGLYLGLDGWLRSDELGAFPKVLIRPSPRSSPLAPGVLGLVWHWTGGPCLGPAYAEALAAEISTWNGRSGQRAVSWHFLVTKNGRILQSIPTTKGAWHVGRPGSIGGIRLANVNSGTIGIELENAGRLTMLSGARSARCEGYPDKPIPVSRAVPYGPDAGAWFDEFPEPQVRAATELARVLAKAFKLEREACAYGHSQLDLGRKTDPGPLWLERHLPRVLDDVFSRGDA